MSEEDPGNSASTFLFSSRTDNPDRFFQGYFFHDTDYVFGETGFRAFSRKRGVTRLFREDGCYVQMEKLNDGYRFSADYGGYKKIFYFWDSGLWIVSNSLYQVVQHLRQNGYPIRPNISQLAAAATEGTFYPSGRGSFFGQLTSFDTMVEGVRLAPMNRALWIGSAGVRMEKLEFPHPGGDYRNHLTRFINTWVARLQTLIRESDIQVACDLTGGLDSRVVLALLLGGLGDSDPGARERLQIRSSTHPGARKDRNLAAKICGHFDLALNGSLKKYPKRLSGVSSYALWRDLCLGVYHPVYFPHAAMSPRMVHLSGGGGENHRPFYGQFLSAPSSETFVATRTLDISPRPARQDFKAALQQVVATIMDDASEGLDLLAAHYRHFRNRFHTGREPNYTVTLPLLASRLLDDCTAVAGKTRFRNAQMHYDILFNLKPELLDFPFDKWRKRPGRMVRRSFTSTHGETALPTGTCFIGSDPITCKPRSGEPRAIDLLREKFSEAKDGFASEFLGSAYIRKAERAVEAATDANGFSGPGASKRVAVVLAAGMFET